MPNWCNNMVTLTHGDEKMLTKAHEAFNDGRLFQTFIPCPRPLAETESVSYCGKNHDAETLVMIERQEALEAINMKHYGFTTWYDWCLANWGVKWDVGARDGLEPELIGDRLELCFDSAWGAPIEAYDKFVELGFTVEAYYYEPGMAFCGYYHDGEDESYKIPGSAEEVREQIPSHIDEAFCISENMDLDEQYQQHDSEGAKT